MQAVQPFQHGLYTPRAGLEDRRRVQRNVLDPHFLQIGGAGGDSVRFRVEGFARLVARPGWRCDHALPADPFRITAGLDRRFADRIHGALGEFRIGDPARQPALAILTATPCGDFGSIAMATEL